MIVHYRGYGDDSTIPATGTSAPTTTTDASAAAPSAPATVTPVPMSADSGITSQLVVGAPSAPATAPGMSTTQKTLLLGAVGGVMGSIGLAWLQGGKGKGKGKGGKKRRR